MNSSKKITSLQTRKLSLSQSKLKLITLPRRIRKN